MPSTILIVDDEYSGRETLQSILEGEGYNLIMAENGPQAITQAKSILPDVILLDVMMPGMTGFEVCEKIRNDPQVAEIPIIILTAPGRPGLSFERIKSRRRRLHLEAIRPF